MKPAVLILALLSGDVLSSGIAAYREGRFRDALEAFRSAETRAGDAASAELLYDRARAALAVGELVEAQIAAEKAAARGGDRFLALRDFLEGSVAFERCLRAEVMVSGPDARPGAFDRPIRRAREARDAWIRAAASRADWPQARRNLERALLKLEQLERQQAELRQQDVQDEQKKDDRNRPDPRLADQRQREERGSAPELDLIDDELTPEQVLALFERLDEKEREKGALRRAQRRVRQQDVEKDW